MSNAEIIGPKILENYEFLKNICRTTSCRKQKKLIKAANPEQLICIVESCLNILKSKFKLRPFYKNKLIPHAELIRKISKVRSERGARRVIQKGGGILSVILSPVLAAAAKVLINKISKK